MGAAAEACSCPPFGTRLCKLRCSRVCLALPCRFPVPLRLALRPNNGHAKPASASNSLNAASIKTVVRSLLIASPPRVDRRAAVNALALLYTVYTRAMATTHRTVPSYPGHRH
eukprot:6135876-Pleurochrysis_carterae.AAC.2